MTINKAKQLRSLLWLVIAGAAGASQAAELQCSAKSGPVSATVLELYTSEGCNSCPPTDKWVSELQRNGFSGDKVIPLAMHVDYWDYIGWKDRFSNPDFGRRQKAIAQTNGSGVVYTPQVVINGKDLRLHDSYAKLREQVNLMSSKPPRAEIQLALQQSEPASIRISGSVQLASSVTRTRTAVYLAFYENHLASDVKAGENRGVKLEHDYVVRRLVGPLLPDASGKLQIEQKLALDPAWKVKDSGVTAFVQDSVSGDVLQALQLPWCEA
jgi:hypothetical protein